MSKLSFVSNRTLASNNIQTCREVKNNLNCLKVVFLLAANTAATPAADTAATQVCSNTAFKRHLEIKYLIMLKPTCSGYVVFCIMMIIFYYL